MLNSRKFNKVGEKQLLENIVRISIIKKVKFDFTLFFFMTCINYRNIYCGHCTLQIFLKIYLYIYVERGGAEKLSILPNKRTFKQKVCDV